MPRSMPPLASDFSAMVDRATQIAQAGEVLSALERTKKKNMNVPRLESLYETAFLRIFLAWESFLEDSFHRFLCGYPTPSTSPTLLVGRFQNLQAAASHVLGPHDFVSWTQPKGIVSRSQRYIQQGKHETVINSNSARLQHLASVRNRIAHRSQYSRTMFDGATISLAGRRYRGGSPGRFLRDNDPISNPPERWLRSLGKELVGLAGQITA